ncbi:MAG: NAD(P)/FAD-dependent oxidoreductase [Bordetella sp.]|nr:NAD(P)/FAD-dependent oxidoreductase [Bordetella sp.]
MRRALPAAGIFNTPVVPNFAHAQSFEGVAFHSAQWRDAVDLRGCRVAVIGSGASAVQIVPALAGIAASVDVVQRSPLYVMSRKPVDMGAMASERERLFREFHEVANRRKSTEGAQAGQQAFADPLERTVCDPDLRRALTPGFLFGCKRTLFSDEWYPALQKPNVRPIFARIERLTPTGIAFTDGTSAEVDAIVYATGFDPARYLPGLEVEANATTPRDTWRQGVRAHLGISVAGFPNLLFMYGPNTNAAGSVVHMHECRARYIV